MRRDRPISFEPLEGRQLMTTAHPASVAAPVVLNGTLSVNVNDSSQIENMDGSWTTTVPVSGVLATMGKVKGYWETSIDPYGNYLGPDELVLQTNNPKGSADPKGTVTIDFTNENTGKAKKISPGLGFYQHGEQLASGSGAYSKVFENGSIELMVNMKKGSVTSIVLISVNT
jgi:hypothetical protein